MRRTTWWKIASIGVAMLHLARAATAGEAEWKAPAEAKATKNPVLEDFGGPGGHAPVEASVRERPVEPGSPYPIAGGKEMTNDRSAEPSA